MRDERELVELIRELKKWFQEDFQLPYDSSLIFDYIEKLKALRVNDFVKRRLGHLRDNDLIRFAKLFKEDPIREIPKQVIEKDGRKAKQGIK